MDEPLVDQLSCQWHSWVAKFGRDKRWRHLSAKPPSRWDFPSRNGVRSHEDNVVIGLRCKCSNVFSWQVLIDRGLDLIVLTFECSMCNFQGLIKILKDLCVDTFMWKHRLYDIRSDYMFCESKIYMSEIQWWWRRGHTCSHTEHRSKVLQRRGYLAGSCLGE